MYSTWPYWLTSISSRKVFSDLPTVCEQRIRKHSYYLKKKNCKKTKIFSIVTKMPIKPTDDVFPYVLCTHTTQIICCNILEHSIYTLISYKLKTYPVQVRRPCVPCTVQGWHVLALAWIFCQASRSQGIKLWPWALLNGTLPFLCLEGTWKLQRYFEELWRVDTWFSMVN